MLLLADRIMKAGYVFFYIADRLHSAYTVQYILYSAVQYSIVQYSTYCIVQSRADDETGYTLRE